MSARPIDEDARLLLDALAAVYREQGALPIIRGLLATRLHDGGLSPVRIASRVGVRRVIVRSWLASWQRSTEEDRLAADDFPTPLLPGEEIDQLRALRGRSTELRRELHEFARAAAAAGVTVDHMARATGASATRVRGWTGSGSRRP